MFLKAFLLLSYILITSVLGARTSRNVLKSKSNSNNRIVGGFEINIKDVPWQVSLHAEEEHFCGGSIIGSNWILTAAHCTISEDALNDPTRITVRTGANIPWDGARSRVKRIFNHPKYNHITLDYDFALLKLENEIEFDGSRTAIGLAATNDSYVDGSMCMVTGWGDTLNSEETSDILRGVEIPIFPQDECNQIYGNNRVTSSMICVGYMEGGKDTCHGDSGGPLTLCVNGEPKLIGVVSWGKGCALPNFPGVYGRVQEARAWISEVTGI